MGEIREWFERELSPYGFDLTMLTYDQLTFAPMLGITYTYGGRCVKLRTRITPELANDLQAYGRVYQNGMLDDYREIVVNSIIRDVESMGHPNPFWDKPRLIDFTPNKEITKFKFT